MKTELEFPTVITFFLTTFAIGFFPISIGVLSSHYYLLNKYAESAKRLNENIPKGDKPRKETTETSGCVLITSENEKDKIEVSLHDLLFIKSVDNYIEVYKTHHNNIKKTLLRGTLKRIEEDLKLVPCLFRCHRTYIVNVNNISKVTGNSQGYKLLFNFIDYSIPVSRDCSKTLLKMIA
ncbi:MAG: LytTR family transcriptional regulator [Candidatus Aminicenantes bacterium]|nr:LytTR family transcriptional regulator [Candidatus Aminicenantes bacterium]